MDREATATKGERRKERDGEGVGTKVPGLSTGSQEADRDRAGECRTIQRTGSRIVGWEKESHAATNCETTGTGTYEAGGDTTDWPKREPPIQGLEGWIRRHIRKCFWLRWHSRRGRLRRLRHLGIGERGLGIAYHSGGAWRMSRHPVLNSALSNAVLRRHGFLFPSDLRA